MTMIKRFLYAVAFIQLFAIQGCSATNINDRQFQEDDELVVLAHGFARSDAAMWKLAQRLEEANFQVCRLDYSTIGKSVEDLLKQTSAQISACIKDAPKAHFVGHSLGGLVIRAYLQNHQQALKEFNLEGTKLGGVVLIGTPNNGSEVADHFRDSWLMNLGGGVSQALVTGEKSFGHQLAELELNLGVIAGTKSSTLTKELFVGENDGLVSVESTKLKNMTDFIKVHSGHAQLRYSDEVAEQTIYFLKEGKFKH